MRTIADLDHGRDNNFNLLRLSAATVVLASHAASMVLGPAVVEPFAAAIGYSYGVVAVAVFFGVSGFFITKSFARRISLADFMVARAARICPALLCVLVLSALLLGPLFTDLTVIRYFGTQATWTYVPQNLALVHQEYSLPGVFTRNPITRMVNPSLWTLKYEVACYLGVVVVGYANMLRPRLFLAVIAVAALAAVLVPGPSMLLPGRLALLASSFAIGAGCYVYRCWVPVGVVPFVALIVAAVLLRETSIYPFTLAATLSYSAVALGFVRTPILQRYNAFGDYSYGLYIYAFPVGQALVVLMPGAGVAMVTAANVAVALGFAILSWHLIESPALAHRHRLAAAVRLDRIAGLSRIRAGSAPGRR